MIFNRLERERQWRAIKREQTAPFWRGWKLILLAIILYLAAHLVIVFARWNW